MQTERFVIRDPEDIKPIVHKTRKGKNLSQEKLSELADLPDMHQTYQRAMHSHKGNWFTFVKLILAMGCKIIIEIPKQEEQ